MALVPYHTAPARTVSGSKRPRSPDYGESPAPPSTKRVRATPPAQPPANREAQREKRHTEREQKEAEFRHKYRTAFPTFAFYLDADNIDCSVHSLKSRILHLGGKIHQFFSSEVTHLITDVTVPQNSNPDKENSQNVRTTASRTVPGLKSPIKLVNRAGEDPTSYGLVQNAQQWKKKIWSSAKLDSVLSRCLPEPVLSKAAVNSRQSGNASQVPQRALSRLLQTEKIHGSTERDPNEKRHDYHYFTRGSCFVLLEDMRRELATIALHEYPVVKDIDKSSKKPWPVLYGHPHCRNPFIPFDDKEKRRWERQQQAEKDEEAERAARKKRQMQLAALKRKAQQKENKKDDLRRTVSLSNFRRQLFPDAEPNNCVDLDDDYDEESANASGYLASGAYVAASGNSVGITSTTGTTSTSGHGLRNGQLPAPLHDRMKQHVVTNLKFPVKADNNAMGPPSKVPNKQPVLRKSKSMNTVKLPKREEGDKPGYCESCRMKFTDFKTHLVSKKHQQFATTSTNFEALDFVLDRLRRRTHQEMEREEAKFASQLHSRYMEHLSK
ncbi:hypothetical protein NLJ89_g5514 [Agrocybe chaxingu]|uniref:DBF4-type domain-containing protein n=1 Tax=Agrocybe chaxingu TaxID=84603 RepID=A0A9W8K296_9AGAR|nr:hypothetical protein NLJ89_g5514 [Agrocybe chaxingu]